MSKRTSLGQSNTLFNYFSSPKGKPTPKKEDSMQTNGNGEKAGKSQQTKENVEKTGGSKSKENDEKTGGSKTKEIVEKAGRCERDSDSEEEIVATRSKKRSRIIVHSDSESEADRPNKQLKKKACIDSDSEEEVSKKQKTVKASLKSFTYGKTPTKTGSEKATDNEPLKTTQPQVVSIHNNWLHNRLEFLKPDKIRDANKRKPNDPNYESKTVFVPEDYLNSLTPAMRQWWILKSTHMDTVLFFKVGKFYELYHMDAVIGVKHLGFSYMKGEFAHSGFPESAYAKMATSLIDQGFKVARVEQTETPEMMNERVKKLKKATKFDKVVNRELCQVSSKAACIYGAQLPEAKNSLPCYLFALCEKPMATGKIRFGVCFVETSLGIIRLSEFVDDKCCSRLLAILSEFPSGMILLERGKTSPKVVDILKTYYPDVRRDMLASGSQFYGPSKTLEMLLAGSYFMDQNEQFEWPSFFKELAEGCLPKPEYELALKSLGACVWYLKDSQIDMQVISMKKFELYEPVDIAMKDKKISRDYLVLDAVTIDNLSLLGGKGTLQRTLSHCETAFGKRLLQQWICRPLGDIEKIAERQKAIRELYEHPNILKSLQDIMKKLPDLERQVAKIHIYGNKFCAQGHPDSRAVFYEHKVYSKRKIIDLLKTLKAFERTQEIPEIFAGCQSRLLKKITQFEPVGMYIDLSSSLNYFKEAFDQEQAEKEGKILPKIGVDDEYDASQEKIAMIQKELDAYLEKQKRFFACKVTYFGSDKKRFQLEVPESMAKKATDDYQLEGSRKGVCKRFSTATTRQLLQDMMRAESERAKIVQDLNRRIFEKFSRRREQWEQVTHCLTILDVLSSLAQYAQSYSQDICMPEILPAEDDAKIIIEEGRHPCIQNIETFVPNDTKMGVDGYAPILLLTGPNMGGKSTLMRQVAIIIVMAQMGGYVPATVCKLTLVDRIFTRLGAHDNIIGGQSTFFVELSEASTILQHATSSSLVLVDELGRGTSTHDGNAIATAYVKKLTTIKCRTIFSTHYHSLVDHFIGRDDVQLGHMACMVENDEDPTQESVTFLYKMAQGRCPKSYGFNAARLAGLPHSIVVRAREVAKELEEIANNRQIVRKLFAGGVKSIREIVMNV